MGQPTRSRRPMPDRGLPRWPPRLVLATALLVGCTPPLVRQAHPAELQADWLAFLVDGKTTREEVLLRFGTPSARFEGERILTYAFSGRAAGRRIRERRHLTRAEKVPVFMSPGMENLVLVFDADGRLARHSLVVSE